MSPRTIALTVIAALLLTVPYWVSGVYHVNVASQILFFAIFALGLNILVGYGGLVSLGHAGLFGVAAYATGYMLHIGYGHSLSIIVAFVIGIVSMAMFAVLSLRSTGIAVARLSAEQKYYRYRHSLKVAACLPSDHSLLAFNSPYSNA